MTGAGQMIAVDDNGLESLIKSEMSVGLALTSQVAETHHIFYAPKKCLYFVKNN
jgi:hypothetical protein